MTDVAGQCESEGVFSFASHDEGVSVGQVYLTTERLVACVLYLENNPDSNHIYFMPKNALLNHGTTLQAASKYS